MKNNKLKEEWKNLPKRKLIDVKEFVRNAKKVRESFREQEEYLRRTKLEREKHGTETRG